MNKKHMVKTHVCDVLNCVKHRKCNKLNCSISFITCQKGTSKLKCSSKTFDFTAKLKQLKSNFNFTPRQMMCERHSTLKMLFDKCVSNCVWIQVVVTLSVTPNNFNVSGSSKSTIKRTIYYDRIKA